jgi:GMP synthase (glutamine-hydrolysing)
MKIYVIDNGGQWTHREWRVLKYLGVNVEIKGNESNVEELSDADGLVLSGGAPSIAYESFRLGKTSDYLSRMDIPILGICAGAQFMGMFYGGRVEPAVHPEFGKVKIRINNRDALLKDIPPEFIAWESHNDEIKALPDGFELLASSDTCKIQVFSNEKMGRFGIQFHPEVEHTEFGEKIFRNFLDLCAP